MTKDEIQAKVNAAFTAFKAVPRGDTGYSFSIPGGSSVVVRVFDARITAPLVSITSDPDHGYFGYALVRLDVAKYREALGENKKSEIGYSADLLPTTTSGIMRALIKPEYWDVVA